MESPTNSNRLLDAAIESAIEAGRILRSEYDGPVQISPKGELDLVTQADRRSEEAIVARLRKYFPTHAILSEEGGGQRAMRAIAGLSIRSTAPRILPTAIHASLFPSDSKRPEN
jgi:3'-phosphoadenosine 5'-phosphosulfate (PAPS) 3'-phosphatase